MYLFWLQTQGDSQWINLTDAQGNCLRPPQVSIKMIIKKSDKILGSGVSLKKHSFDRISPASMQSTVIKIAPPNEAAFLPCWHPCHALDLGKTTWAEKHKSRQNLKDWVSVNGPSYISLFLWGPKCPVHPSDPKYKGSPLRDECEYESP